MPKYKVVYEITIEAPNEELAGQYAGQFAGLTWWEPKHCTQWQRDWYEALPPDTHIHISEIKEIKSDH